ncbi:hypothetical protein [Cytobacillus praedii]|nr:hypothetical protein [Cytobacillus praedii]
MVKFKVRVFREDEYEIEIDENIHNDQWMDVRDTLAVLANQLK